MPINPNIEIAHRLQERFDFYLIALTFTILGLSIQTAEFNEHNPSNILEVLSWFTLFLSGLVGLSRLEWIPAVFNAHAEVEESESEAVRLRRAQALGQTEVPLIGEERQTAPIEEAINSHQAFADNSRPMVEKLNNITLIKYRIHKWSLVAGMFLLIMARAIEPIADIASKLCNNT